MDAPRTARAISLTIVRIRNEDGSRHWPVAKRGDDMAVRTAAKLCRLLSKFAFLPPFRQTPLPVGSSKNGGDAWVSLTERTANEPNTCGEQEEGGKIATAVNPGQIYQAAALQIVKPTKRSAPSYARRALPETGHAS